MWQHANRHIRLCVFVSKERDHKKKHFNKMSHFRFFFTKSLAFNTLKFTGHLLRRKGVSLPPSHKERFHFSKRISEPVSTMIYCAMVYFYISIIYIFIFTRTLSGNNRIQFCMLASNNNIAAKRMFQLLITKSKIKCKSWGRGKWRLIRQCVELFLCFSRASI